MAGTREAIDAAHLRSVETGEASEDQVRQIPGQQDFSGAVQPPQGVEAYPEEIRIDGTTQLAVFDLGGKKAGGATLRLVGKVSLTEGQGLSKGEVLKFSGVAVVREVGQKDKKDNATGIVVSCEQKHVAEIVDLRLQ